MSLVDVARMLVILLGIVSLGVAASVFYYFWSRSIPGLLMTHVIRVNLAYYAFVLYGIGEMIARLGTPVTFRLPALVVVFSLSLYAQVPLLKFEKSMARNERAMKNGDK